MASIYLTDLIDVETLQEIQDSFSEMTGMAALTTDDKGVPVTQGSNFTDYCMKYTRQTEEGRRRCEECDRFGAVTTHKTGKATTYMCHSGLMDFSAPILLGDEMIGCFIGGQVLTEPPKEEYIHAVAEDIGVDFEAYWEAIQKVEIIEKEKVEKAAASLQKLAGVLSKMAYSKYETLEASKRVEEAAREIERSANMKSDFLANMSHEIRTPMNAVIGMAEMAMREELSPQAKYYISQIKNSGRSLLNIINDILDYSKIESGKTEIINEEYETLSLFNDVANILSTRIQTKDIELFMEINPMIPYKVLGDYQRVKQVLINIANNAVKFTNKGYVKIVLDCEKIDDESVLMKIAVADTGIGIKEEDLQKLFKSFQQVDSKRNRNVEGTGLGLAISKRLVELMGGSISVESVYEKGTTFSFEIPQKIVDASPAVKVKEAEQKAAGGFFRNRYLARQFYNDMKNLGVYSFALTGVEKLDKIIDINSENIIDKSLNFFIEYEMLTPEMEAFIDSHKEIQFHILVNFFSNMKDDRENVRIFKKPLSAITLAMTLNCEDFSVFSEDSFEYRFIAPDANVLIVDDNEINLTVAEGLLEPLKMKIWTATGGKMALDTISKNKIDLILMDHMMPEMDGIETTRLIRRNHKDYDEVPIIALTANAVEGTKEMFLSEGMNDFVAKPIEVKTLVSKVKQWLPIEKIKKVSDTEAAVEDSSENEEIAPIGDLEIDEAVKLLGSKKLFMNILKEYYKAIPNKSKLIKAHKDCEDWPAFTIEVHALKSLSKQIGAMELSGMAAELEKAGNARNEDFIKKYTEPMLEKYVGYESVLAEIFEEKQETATDKPPISADELENFFKSMSLACDDLDMDVMEQVIEEMSMYAYEDNQKELFEELKSAAENIDVDACDKIIAKWRGGINE